MFNGVYTALATPFLAGGKTDFQALELLIEKQIAAGVDGIVLLGTTAEAATMDEAEKDELLCAAVKQINKRVKIIIGTGTNSTRTMLQNTEAALKHNPDGVLIVTPYYNKPNPSGLIEHFRRAGDSKPVRRVNMGIRKNHTASITENFIHSADLPKIKESRCCK